MAKRKKIIRRAIAVFVLLVVLIPCSVLLYDAIMTSEETKVEFYYMMSDGKMKPIERNIKSGVPKEMVDEILVLLKEGPKTDGATASIPEDVEFLFAEIEEDTAVVNVSSGYYHLQGVEEVICRSSIVWTLTSLDFVENVKILVEGQPLTNKEGEERGVMNRQNILIDSVVSAETTEYAILKLYFANADGTDLVVEERVVEVNANQAREKTILEQLIAGPLNKEYKSVIPAETKIRDVTTTSDGTCYVNLSQEFVTKQSGGLEGEALTVYSIVNSLCELDGVDKVQFLIEGQKQDEYKGKLDFKTPFTAISSLKTAEIQ